MKTGGGTVYLCLSPFRRQHISTMETGTNEGMDAVTANETHDQLCCCEDKSPSELPRENLSVSRTDFNFNFLPKYCRPTALREVFESSALDCRSMVSTFSMQEGLYRRGSFPQSLYLRVHHLYISLYCVYKKCRCVSAPPYEYFSG